MKKFLWALVPLVSLGTLSWLPFVVLKDDRKTLIFGILTGVYAIMILTVPSGGALAPAAGMYVVGFFGAAAILAYLGFKTKEDLAARRATLDDGKSYGGPVGFDKEL